MNKISAVYKITNTITGDFYIGSSKNIKSRLTVHKCPSTWKKFRVFKKKEQNNLDYISQRILPKGANLHHLDEKHYDDLSPEKFVFLGKTMHKVVHFLYIYYKKDHTIIERLKEVLDRMEKYDNDL